MYSLLVSVLPFAFIGFIGLTPGSTNACGHWSYQEEEDWVRMFLPCNGSQQSPINIISNSAFNNRTFPPLEFGQWYQRSAENATIVNNGHTAQVSIGLDAIVSGGPLHDGNYTLAQFHFHWGRNDSFGAEHHLDCRKFSLEIHFVHYNNKYSTLKEALGKKGGVAVLGVWMRAHADSEDNEAMESVIEALRQIKEKGDKMEFSMNQPLLALIPKDWDSYFTYKGSLTTPPCTQKIVWIIFTQLQSISRKQLQAFRNLHEEEPKGVPEHLLLKTNYRDIQPLNDRYIYLAGPKINFPPSKCPDLNTTN